MKRFLVAGVVALAVAFTGTAIAADGAAVYKAKCAMCHGADGQGGTMGAKFQGSDFIKKGSEADIAGVIKNGRAGAAKKYKDIKMDMPKQTLSDDEVKAVIGHLKTVAGK